MALRILLALLLLCVSAQSADLKLAWDDPQTGVTYNVYEQVSGKLTKLGSATTKEFPLKNVSPGPHTYVVTAVSAGVEGAPSEPALLPGGVLNLRIVTTVSLEIK